MEYKGQRFSDDDWDFDEEEAEERKIYESFAKAFTLKNALSLLFLGYVIGMIMVIVNT